MDEMNKTYEMTKDQMIMELLKLLNQNQMQKQANDVFELCTYTDILQKKLDAMTEEIAGLRRQVMEMQENTFSKQLKTSVETAVHRLDERHRSMKQQLSMIKKDITANARKIVMDFGKQGKKALYQVSELWNVKEKLVSMLDKVRVSIADTAHMIQKIEIFGQGIRESNQKIANIFRAFSGKDEVDYSQKEKTFSKIELATKPWRWQKRMYEAMERLLDAAIEKAENLEKSVEKSHIIAEEDIEKAERQMETMSLVAENEHQYGADTFEASLGRNEMGGSNMPKTKTIKHKHCR